MWWSLAAAIVLRRETDNEPVPSFEEYVGFDADEDAAMNASAIPGLQPLVAVANATIEPRVQCPAGIRADVQQLQWRMEHAPRLYSSQPAPPKPSYLFIIVPPGYGSTALLSLLATSPRVGTLCGSGALNCEGCYILYGHGLMAHEDRWQRDQPPDWTKAAEQFDAYYPEGKPIKVEKSPNNIVKTERIAAQLTRAGHNVRFVVMSRSPCFVGYGGHHGAGIYVRAWDFFAREMLQTLQRKSAGSGTVAALHLRYEDLLRDPYAVTEQLLDFMPELGSLDPTVNRLAERGGKMLDAGKNGDRSKSVVGYLLKYRHIAADYKSVDGGFRPLMQQLGYAAPAV